VFYIGPFLLFAMMRGRGYYLLPAYPILYAAGAVALERALDLRSKAVRITACAAVCVALLIDSALVGWEYLPIWHPGSAAWSWQMKNNGDMANLVGWPEFVAQVAAVRDSLPSQDRARLAILATNYGEAGALALYGPQYQLPTPISNANSFHDRGYGPYEPEMVIVVGSRLADESANFESCSVAAYVHLPYDVQDEESADHPEILICRHLREPWPVMWSHSQIFG
jgi:hypothetical protein